jgi:truncated hemoglobin YjbI
MAVNPGGSPDRGPLYERLGGWGGLAVVAELWCDRVLTDAKLADYYLAANPEEVKRAQTEFLVHLTGGPIPSPLQPLPPLYAAVPLSEWHAERLTSHLIAALIWCNVPRLVIEEILDVLTPLTPPTRPSSPPNGGPTKPT